MISRRNLCLATMAAVSAHPLALAQGGADKTMRLVVPFAPGGFFDTIGRLVAKSLQQRLQANFVVDNRPGAGGGLGAAHVARQTPDAQTLLFSGLNFVIQPEADKVLGRQPQYSVDQFTPVAMVTNGPLIVLVPASSPWKRLDELMRDARAQPGKLTYSSSGLYGNIHLPAEMLFRQAGAKLVHVPYQGGAPAMNALLAGDVSLTLQSPAVAIPHIRSGKLRALATFSPEREAALPDVPTLREMGQPMELSNWVALFAPKGTPDAALAPIRAALREAAVSPEFRATVEAQGGVVRFLEGAALQQEIARDTKAFAEVVRGIGRLE